MVLSLNKKMILGKRFLPIVLLESTTGVPQARIVAATKKL
jgi:hypothetical protein